MKNKLHTRTRPGLLNSDIARGNIRDHSVPELASVLSTIDRFKNIHEGLSAVRETDDPRLTPEARALKYRDAWQRAADVATKEVRAVADRILAAKARLANDAKGRAGLLATYGNEAEIRAALRAMSPKDRDRAISDAFSQGDHQVVAAIQAHEILIGNPSLPLGTLTENFIMERAVEETAQIADLVAGLDELQLAFSAFSTSVEEMRDLRAEERGDAEVKTAQEADAKLGLALQAAAGA